MFKKFSTTGIGSMPHIAPERACGIILDNVDIPFWPQLPKRSFRELMIPQYSEGMPLVKIVPEEQKIWIAVDNGDLDAFYETYSEESEFEVSDEFARGFHVFSEIIQGRQFPVLKGQVTGPLTFTLGLKDDAGVPIYFNEELREIGLMVLKGKVRWQIRRLRTFCERVMIFIDEPILSAIGTSSYMGVSDDEVKRLLVEIASSIKQAGGISAIHCCGKADWQTVMETGIDVVNFDAFDYFENFQIYSDVLKAFLDRGGYIAWGIVPTDENIKRTTPTVLAETIAGQVDVLSQKLGSDDFVKRIILTPSCGAGSLTEQDAEKVFDMLKELKQALLGETL